ncbi:tRNA dihydrouridine synthase B [hydrothermal vent metagenome]|uniref:tRNA dihydrouridine synthase B n=1 Tax=hydrothermal vent metagenome TaxID=652676 RepID=A0A1W1CYD8_9ZZZZ
MFANGDITSPEKAKWVLEHTKADGIMIGRTAVGKPWIFKQIKEGMEVASASLIKEVVLEHYDQMITHYDKYGAIILEIKSMLLKILLK